jgi:hypothetical protein
MQALVELRTDGNRVRGDLRVRPVKPLIVGNHLQRENFITSLPSLLQRGDAMMFT